MARKAAGEPSKPSAKQDLAARTEKMSERERKAKKDLEKRKQKMADREAKAKQRLGQGR
jgi:hypothetical protein